jgi:uncharacterized glyoxalase superfamily protein PhnB
MKTLLAVVFPMSTLQTGQNPKTAKESPTMKITPLIYAPTIEPELKFWVDQLGFTKVAEVPDGDKLGFVILVRGNSELMIQSVASMEKDNKAMAELARPSACLYIEVDDFDDLLKRLGSAPVVVPIRTTFYGLKEIGVRDPGSNVVLFGAKVAQATHP